MCESVTPFPIEFNRRLNLWMARNRLAMYCTIDFAGFSPRTQPNNKDYILIYFPELTQKLIKGGGPWGEDGLEFLTPEQAAFMDRIIEVIALMDSTLMFGMDGEKFFINLKGSRLDAIRLRLSL